MSRKILRKSALLEKTGLGSTRQYELERDGLFPKRVQLSDRAVGWFEDEVDAWLESRPRAGAVNPSAAA